MYHHLLSQTMGSDVHLYTKNEHTAQQDYFSFQVKDRHREGTSGFPGTSNWEDLKVDLRPVGLQGTLNSDNQEG